MTVWRIEAKGSRAGGCAAIAANDEQERDRPASEIKTAYGVNYGTPIATGTLPTDYHGPAAVLYNHEWAE